MPSFQRSATLQDEASPAIEDFEHHVSILADQGQEEDGTEVEVIVPQKLGTIAESLGVTLSADFTVKSVVAGGAAEEQGVTLGMRLVVIDAEDVKNSRSAEQAWRAAPSEDFVCLFKRPAS